MKTGLKSFLKGLAIASVLVQGFSSESYAVPPIRVIVYGDSLMSGFQLQPEQAFTAKLNRKLKEYGFTNVDVTDMSVPGETSAGGLERIDSVVNLHPDVVVLELGANDMLRGINAGVVYNNLSGMISKLLQSRAYVVFVGMKAPSNMGYSYSAQMEQGYRTLAEAYKIAYYPFALEGVVGQPDLNLADGYHPNAKGVDVMVERIYPLVDTGVRARWESAITQQDYQGQMQNQMQMQGGVSMPSANPTVNSPQMPAIPQPLGDR